MKQPIIVYSAIGRRGIIRMSLHPVLDSSRTSKGPRFPCRVVFSYGGLFGGRWATSCRGLDSRSGRTAAEYVTRDGPAMQEFWALPNEDVDGNAIAWLLAGEKGGAK